MMTTQTFAAVAGAIVVAMGAASCAVSDDGGDLTGVESEAWYQERLEAWWGQALSGNAALERPETAVSAVVEPGEFSGAYVLCMHDAGFDQLVAIDDGFDEGTIADNEMDDFLLAQYKCRAAYPVNPKYVSPA